MAFMLMVADFCAYAYAGTLQAQVDRGYWPAAVTTASFEP